LLTFPSKKRNNPRALCPNNKDPGTNKKTLALLVLRVHLYFGPRRFVAHASFSEYLASLTLRRLL
jgi:hypothetical protein